MACVVYFVWRWTVLYSCILDRAVCLFAHQKESGRVVHLTRLWTSWWTYTVGWMVFVVLMGAVRELRVACTCAGASQSGQCAGTKFPFIQVS